MSVIIDFDIIFNEDKTTDPNIGKFRFRTDETFLTITPELLYENNPHLKNRKIKGFNANIECDKIVLVIKEFEYFTLKRYGLSNASVALLKVFDISDFFRIIGFCVERFDVEWSNSLIVNCDIQELNIGIGNSRQSLLTTPRDLFYTDIRESSIVKTRFFISQTKVNIQNSNCKQVVFECDAKFVDDTYIWENSLIEKLIFTGFFKNIEIKRASIVNMMFAKPAQIENIEIQSSIIENVHDAYQQTFIVKTVDNWSLIANSAKRKNDSALFSLASFECLKLERENSKNFHVFNLLMELVSGYGYKPIRTVISSLLIWLLFSIFYWLISVYSYGGLKLQNEEFIVGLKGLGYALYFSLITFTTTAFGDIIPIGFWAKLLAGIQTLLGIIFMSLFIFALTKRYGSFR